MHQDEQKRQQDSLRRIDQRLNVLEERIAALLRNIDFELMTPVQRVQATCRLIKLMMDLLKLRKLYAEPDGAIEQIPSNLILSIENVVENLMEN